MIARIVSVALAIMTLSTNELLTPCGMDSDLFAQQIGDMGYLATDFLDAEAETGVNAVLLASIAALESGWGSSWAAENKNNLFGITGSDGLRLFESKRECIFYTARLLKDHYLSEDGKYYTDGSLESIAEIYCESDGWAEKVTEIMEGINNVSL